MLKASCCCCCDPSVKDISRPYESRTCKFRRGLRFSLEDWRTIRRVINYEAQRRVHTWIHQSLKIYHFGCSRKLHNLCWELEMYKMMRVGCISLKLRLWQMLCDAFSFMHLLNAVPR